MAVKKCLLHSTTRSLCDDLRGDIDRTTQIGDSPSQNIDHE